MLYQNYIKKYFIALNGKTILMLEKVCIYKFRYKSLNVILLSLSRFLWPENKKLLYENVPCCLQNKYLLQKGMNSNTGEL